jgi:DNA-binding NtrC family response regulator
LAARAWPGNIRELRNTLEQAALMTDDLVLEPRHFGEAEAAAPPPAPLGLPAAALRGAPVRAPEPPLPPSTTTPLGDQIAELERRTIAATLQATRGNKVLAARQLGISRAALYDRLARWPELAAIGAG